MGSRTYIKVGNDLKKEILQGKYKIGERLPTEREISERFKVSRTIVREAIVMLEVEQFVTVKKGSGVYVAKLADDISKEKKEISKLIDIGPFELLQARQILESNIAELAAQVVTKKDIIKLKKILDKEQLQLMENSKDYTADRDFHLTIAEITQNDVLIRIQQDLWEYRFNNAMWDQLHSRILENNYRHLWLEDHQNILSAIQRKDSYAAKKMMWQHLENVKVKLFELSDVEDPMFDGYLFNINPIITGI